MLHKPESEKKIGDDGRGHARTPPGTRCMNAFRRALSRCHPLTPVKRGMSGALTGKVDVHPTVLAQIL